MADHAPNVIFIITDQQRADTIGSANSDWAITPSLDRLAADAIVFDRAFACGAACVASRSALFTGMYAHNTGVYSNDCLWGHQRTWLDDLRDAGFRLVNVGKMHARDAPMAFHERYIVENKSSRLNYDEWNRYLWRSGLDIPRRHETARGWRQQLNSEAWPYDEKYHCDVFTGNLALDFIARWDRDQPLFLQIGFPGPHEPYDPLPRILAMYEDRDVPPRIFHEGELARKPPLQAAFKRFKENTPHEEQIDLSNSTNADIDRMRRHYAAGITGIDEKIGEILDLLESKGLLQDSIVVFTSDHGDNLGDHDLPYKWFMYDSVTRVPLVIRTPATVGQGRIDSTLFSHIDIGPTLLDMIGLSVPSRLDGRSRVSRVLEADEANAPSAVFAEENHLAMIRTASHKLVHYINEPLGELYDLDADPVEINNLYTATDHLRVRQELERRLLDWIASSNYKNSGHKNLSNPMYEVKWL